MKTKHLLLIFSMMLSIHLWADSGVVVVDCAQRSGGIVKVNQVSNMTYTMTAVANPGYEFLYWSDGETDSTRIYDHVADVSADKTFHAVFAKLADVNMEGGHVDVTVNDPDIPSFNLEAIHSQEAEFYKWNNGSLSTTVPYKETDGTRIPYFVMNSGKVCFSYDPHAGGTIVANNLSGMNCTVEAIPAIGYQFVSWLDGTTDNPRSYTHIDDVTKDKTLFAVFAKTEDIVRPHGTATVSIPVLNTQQYKLKANPDDDAILVSWNNSSTEIEQDYVEADGTLFPIFAAKVGEVTFSYNNHVGGEIKAEVISGLKCKVTAIPAEGYRFQSWMDDNTDNPREYTHVADEENDVDFWACFVKIEDVERPNGTVDVAITDRVDPAFTLTAVPAEDAHLHIWNNGSKDISQNYLESMGTRIPYFVSENGVLSVFLDQHLGGIVTATPKSGLTYEMTATPNTYYEFLYWSDGVTSNPRQYTHTANPLLDKTFHAVFAKTTDIHQTGGHTEIEVVDADEPAFELTAVEDASCAELYMWNNGYTGTTLSYVEEDGRAIPYFTHGDHAVLYENDDHEGGSIIVQDEECGFTLTAQANPGFYFQRWEDDSTNPVRNVQYVEGTYYAYFSACVAMVGTTAYGSLAEAVSAAADGQTLTVLTNTAENMVVPHPIVVNGNGKKIGDMTILCGGKVTMSGNLTINDLYLNTTTGSSAQLINQNKLTYSQAYLDIKLEANNTVASPDKWYGISTPFQVDVASGISRAAGSTSHISGTDYLVWGYDGSSRAQTGNGWKQMLTGTMLPGRFYMIGIEGTQNVWRFAKAADAPLCGSDTITLEEFPSNNIDKGWNAVGNSLLQYANASIADIPFVQVYDNINSRYMVKMTTITSFVVACPFFAQVMDANTMVLSSANDPKELYAPTRRIGLVNEKDNRSIFEVRFMQNEEEIYDALFVSASEDAVPQYEVGKDLIKMGVSTSTPSVWATDYNQMLCVQDAPMVDNQAQYVLSLLATKNAAYTISATSYGNDASLYLTRNGQVIWNLSNAPYVIDLNRGLYKDFGLLLRHNAETNSVTTDLKSQYQNAEIMKFIRDNHLHIIRNGLEYDATGRVVK